MKSNGTIGNNEIGENPNVSYSYWTDYKGRNIEISSMSDKWLNNIRKKLKDKKLKQPILNEINRRNLKRKSNDRGDVSSNK